ncbi:hypothetical protein P0D71_11865 [Paraburkholderia sp. RL17-383-BIF-A]|uniref:hypothetical protein n=1 Tax=Paraburkholderia sp. RL17-383-BIF-A TaxID=3031631 RepID=UPI0038B86FD0
MDDLAAQRRIVVQTLAPRGVSVAEATGAPETPQWLGTTSADLIVISITLARLEPFVESANYPLRSLCPISQLSGQFLPLLPTTVGVRQSFTDNG